MTPATGPHDLPTVAGLLEAVRELLAGAVLESTSGRVRYEVRVAINALAIVERELALGPEHAAIHAAELAELGYESEEALCGAIRRGAAPADNTAMLAFVRASVRRKLEVANPEYLET